MHRITAWLRWPSRSVTGLTGRARASMFLRAASLARRVTWSRVPAPTSAPTRAASRRPDIAVSTGHCYRYTFTIADRVGNVSTSVTATAKVDTDAPIVAATAPTELTGAGNQYYDAGSQTQFFRPAGSGSFTLHATASDGQSGVAQVSFPNVIAVSGWAGSIGGADSTNPYSSPNDYSWSTGATAPGARSITATNAAGIDGDRHDHTRRRLHRPQRPDPHPHGRERSLLQRGLGDVLTRRRERRTAPASTLPAEPSRARPAIWSRAVVPTSAPTRATSPVRTTRSRPIVATATASRSATTSATPRPPSLPPQRST